MLIKGGENVDWSHTPYPKRWIKLLKWSVMHTYIHQIQITWFSWLSDKQIVDMITEVSEHALEKFLPKVKSGFRRQHQTSQAFLCKLEYDSNSTHFQFFVNFRCGYATLHNVMDKSQEDRMESFFLSETSKYLYLVSIKKVWEWYN